MFCWFLDKELRYTKYPVFRVCGTAGLTICNGFSQIRLQDLISNLVIQSFCINHLLPSVYKFGFSEKKCVKALSSEEDCLKYLISKFPKQSFEIIKSVYLKIRRFGRRKFYRKNGRMLKRYSKNSSEIFLETRSRILHRNWPATFRELQKAWFQHKHQISFFV